jgi:hypothetical protein
MQLASSLAALAAFPKPENFGDLRREIDPSWLLDALNARGTAKLRNRRLPAEQVIWLVLGMALFRDRSIVEVAEKLDLAMPGSRGPTAAPSSVAEARARLGEEPMQALFEISAEHWVPASADRHRWRGLSLFGVDGSTLRVPDSDENRALFGTAKGGDRGESGYPLVRVVAQMALRSHLISAVSFGPYARGELAYAKDLWSKTPDNSLTIVDKGFFAASILIPLARDGKHRHWLTRAKKGLKWNVLAPLGPGDHLVAMKVSGQARKQDPSLPKRWLARAINYQRKGFKPEILLTSLLDAQLYPAAEIIELYHERWELELGYDEIKTEMLDREESIRSRSPEMVRQELWGILLAYNLIRLEMERIAEEAKVEPVRISFVMAMNHICDEWLWCAIASPGAVPRHLRNLREKIKRFVLPPRRSHRAYPRAVKIKMSSYARKRRAPVGEATP